jgi:outer membrane autotransporter protein
VAALRGGGGSFDSTFGTLGLRALTALGETTSLRGMLGWRHAFGDRTPTNTPAFATGPSFTAAGVPLARNVAVVEAGIDTRLQRDMTLSASYAAQIGSSLRDSGFKIALNWKF